MLNSLYGTGGDSLEFYDFFDIMRGMVEKYMLGNASNEYSLKQIVYGYYDQRIPMMYNETAVGDKELHLKPFITPVFNDPSK